MVKHIDYWVTADGEKPVCDLTNEELIDALEQAHTSLRDTPATMHWTVAPPLPMEGGFRALVIEALKRSLAK